MRVIAGSCKGRPLKPVPGKSTRPTTDKVKEALFNRIGPFFDGGCGLDLYSGSGSLGIEALSRGLEEMIFVDQDPKAVSVIKENVRQCRLSERAEIYRNDARRALKAIEKRKLRFSHIFLDPPYMRQKLKADLEKISAAEMLESGGVVIIEHHDKVMLDEAYGSLVRQSSDKYGENTVIAVYKWRE